VTDLRDQHPYAVGDWVTITGRIVELHPNDIDLGIEVFSKTDQYTAFVRRDLCAPTAKPIPDEPAEGSVALVGHGGTAWQRLGDSHWYSAGAAITGEGMTWAEVNALGNVEVIHHA
jgi:hypothetical protein